jgi:methionine synthase I (cobalamin-dependent)
MAEPSVYDQILSVPLTSTIPKTQPTTSVYDNLHMIGGCCGTTPDHIAAMAEASRAMFKVAERWATPQRN